MRRTGAALIGAALSFWTAAAAAQDITLSARDGALRLQGRLLGYDGSFYRLDTEHGELTLDGARVDCLGAACPDPQHFVPGARISGAPEIGRVLLPALVEAFAARRGLTARREDGEDGRFSYLLSKGPDGPGWLRLDFALTSSEEGFADLLVSAADIAMSIRPPTAEEVARGREAGVGDLSAPDQGQVLALDAMVPLVAPGNPLTALPYAGLVAALSGELDDWEALGGKPGPIHLIRSGSGPTPAMVRLPVLVPAVAPEVLAAAVAADPQGLALGSYARLGNAKPAALQGSCGLRSTAKVATLKTGDYPLTAPLMLYRPKRHRPAALNEFLDFLLSPAAQPVIRRAGFVDQGILEVPLDAQGRRLAQAISQAGPEVQLSTLQILVDHLAPGARLTPTFRFLDGTAEMDVPSRSAVSVLAQALESGAYDGSRIEFLGFADGNGDAAGNARLAKQRAELVLEMVRRAAPDLAPGAVQFGTASYGEALPILCDGDDWGARINRRVEVWRFPQRPPSDVAGGAE
ncbi:cell envelope biogenesis protein OmpA [Frigidibacter sp. ROC022]|uniref:cell envelope biogenesis protein OmpA n=1 Tax=Frigidibacter sp. ROC022 TaxID=2971796 RepID=UPI00215AA6C3|nr:cell envelope biogenesis protein OmpA [Frigidibacter sp. ROC022]MCR8724425.1 cell envelope biogenesis protein OmpA [Frigidibacter sp. ROC022]